MKRFLALILWLSSVSLVWTQTCVAPPVVSLSDTVYACLGVTNLRIDVDIVNPGNLSGTPQYLLASVGDNSPVFPQIGWLNLLQDESGQLYFIEDFTGVSLRSYNFILKVRYSSEPACESSAVTSTVVVREDPVVGIVAENRVVCAGGDIYLTAFPSQNNCLVQWQERVNGQWRDLAGQTDLTFNAVKMTAGTYAFRAVAASCGGGTDCTAISPPQEVTFLPDPVVTVRMLQGACAGGRIALMAELSDGRTGCRFQWQEFLNNAWTNLPGEENEVLDVRKADAGMYRFRVRLTACEQEDGCTSISDAFTVTVQRDPAVRIQTFSDLACAGGTLRMVAEITDPNGTCQLQWQELIEDQWTDLENITGDFVNITREKAGSYRFRAIIVSCSGGTGCDAVSDPKELVFVEDPVVNVTMDNPETCVGGTLKLRSSIASEHGDCRTGWQELIGGTWRTIDGEEGDSLLVSKAAAGSYFFRSTVGNCSNGGGCDAVSDPAEVVFSSDPVITVLTDLDAACLGGNVRLEAQVVEGLGACRLQWQERMGETWTDIPNANRAVLFVSKNAPGTYLFRIIQNECDENGGCDAISNPFPVEFVADPQIRIEGEDITACAGGVIELSAVISDARSACSLQWEELIGNNWVAVPDAGSAALAVTKENAGEYFFRVRVTGCVDFDGCNAVSAPAQILFEDGPSVTVSSAGEGLCAGGSLQLTANVRNGYGVCAYQWQEWMIDRWADIPGAQASSVRVRSESAGPRDYRVVVTGCEGNDGCQAVAPAFTVVFAEDPIVRLEGNDEACVGEPLEIRAALENIAGACNFQWQRQENGVWKNIIGETAATLTVIHDREGGYAYRVLAAGCTGGSGCDAASSSLAVTVSRNASLQLTPSQTAVCEGTGVSFSAQPEDAAACSRINYAIRREAEDESYVELTTKDAGVPLNLPADLPPGYSLTPAVYRLRAVGECASGNCSAAAEAILTVRPKPALKLPAVEPICSEEPTGIILAPQNPAAAGVLQTSYRIVAVNAAGLIPTAGDPLAAVGLLANDRVIRDDAWLNTGNEPATASYAVIPRFTYADNAFCEGTVRSINIAVLPRPELTQATELSVCSGTPLSARLSTQMTFDEEQVYYLINRIESNDLIAVSGVDPAGTDRLYPAEALADDVWKNTGPRPAEVIYRIQPVILREGGAYCYGVESERRFSIRPAPVLRSIAPLTVCSRTETVENQAGVGIVLSVDNDPAVMGDQLPAAGPDDQLSIRFRLDRITAGEELLAGPANAQPGQTGSADLLAGDTWINTGDQPAEVRYRITPIAIYNEGTADGCLAYGDPREITLIIMPPPAVDIQLNIAGFDYPGSETCGHFDVVLDVEICNNGSVAIDQLDVKLDLDSLANGVINGISQDPVLFMGQNLDQGLNPVFDGRSDQRLFLPEMTGLAAGQCSGYRLHIEVAPDATVADTVAGAGFRATATARGDWSSLAGPAFDAMVGCTAIGSEAEIRLGACWALSRNRTAAALQPVLLDENCRLVLTPETLLAGDRPGCGPESYPLGGFYRLVLVKPGNVREESSPELILDSGDFTTGTASILIEPVFDVCNPIETTLQLDLNTAPRFGAFDTIVTEVRLEKPAQRISSRFSAGGASFDRKSLECAAAGIDFPACELPGQTLAFEVDRAAYFFIELASAETPALLALYRGAVDPTGLCDRLLAQPVSYERSNPAGRLRLSAYLEPGIPYVLWIAGLDCEAAGAPFDVYFFAENNGRIINASAAVADVLADQYFPLWCMEVGNILQQESSTALIPRPPVLGACRSYTTWFEDELFTSGECGLRIRRTWRVRDDQDRVGTPVVQTIQFFRPRSTEIFRPAESLTFACDELTNDQLDANGHPLPAVAGRPFIASAFGRRPFDGSLCNTGAVYQDTPEAPACADRQVIIREWMIIDSCLGSNPNEPAYDTLTTFRQTIRVGDYEAPVVTAPRDVLLSTTVTDCTGELTIAGLSASDLCSENISVTARVYQVREEPLLDDFGRKTEIVREVKELIYTGREGEKVSGLELGYAYLVEYEVSDDCGNVALPVSYRATIVDEIPPSVVCKNDVKVKIGADGRGRLRTADVDGGSRDNCALQSVWISRALAGEMLRDQYLERILGLTFGQLQLARPDLAGQPVETWVLATNPQVHVLRRKEGQWYTAWADDQWFFCEDLGTQVTVELAAADLSGLVAVCSREVTVEKASAPYCVAPANRNLSCVSLPVGFDPEDDDRLATLFGMAEALDDCSATASPVGKILRWNCNSGTIERFFEAVDAQGKTSENSCRQVIQVRAVHNYEIKFPRDAVADCELNGAGAVETNRIGCDLLAVSVTDRRVEGEGNSCFQLERTFKVINWCEYDGISAPVTIPRDADCDQQDGEEDTYVLVRTGGITYLDRDNNENSGDAGSLCGNGGLRHLDNSQLNPALTSTGYWLYTQVVQVSDRTPTTFIVNDGSVFCSSEDNCEADVSIPVFVSENCTVGEIQIRAFLLPDPRSGWPAEVDLQDPAGAALATYQFSGVYPDYRVSARIPLGDHRLVMAADDNCGGVSRDTVAFRVVDCLKPAPTCSGGLTVELEAVPDNADVDGDGDGDAAAVEVRAADFRISNLGDCSDPVTLSINRLGDRPKRNQSSLILTCEDIDTVFVEIYAWDNADNPSAIQLDGTIGGPNYDRCLTYVVVKDDLFDFCETGPTLSGRIATRSGEPVEYVEVNLTGRATGNKTTTNDGIFRFENLPVGGDYTIAPRRNDDHRNGVNTFDLLMLNKHLLRTRPLTNPYQIVAADVNRSRTVSTLDLIHMRRLLLTINDAFPAGESWRFIPSFYVFANPSNPLQEAFPEVLNYNDIRTDIGNANFVGLKTGDLNGTAQANSGSVSPRSFQGLFRLQATDRKLQPGRQYRIPFTAEALSQIEGYQFTLEFDEQSLQLEDIEYGIAGEECFGLHAIDEGTITTSWIRELTRQVKGEEPLFTLVFRSKTSRAIRDLVRITSRRLDAEAYNEVGEVLDVKLVFIEENGRIQSAGDGLQLYQNVPNPWRQTTEIGFYLPEAGPVTLILRDVRGRLLQRINGLFPAGVHQLTLDKAQLPASGILYYTLETEQGVATKKMVLLSD